VAEIVKLPGPHLLAPFIVETAGNGFTVTTEDTVALQPVEVLVPITRYVIEEEGEADTDEPVELLNPVDGDQE
jgi:hypothetical protein